MTTVTSKAIITPLDFPDSVCEPVSVGADATGSAAVQPAPASSQAKPCGMKLADLANGKEARVVAVDASDSAGCAELGRRLAELGFLPGEKLRIVARGLFGREPIAVRIGTGTFALRLFEAACIRVSPELPKAR